MRKTTARRASIPLDSSAPAPPRDAGRDLAETREQSRRALFVIIQGRSAAPLRDSCAITPASLPSVRRRLNRTHVHKDHPPGRAKALISSTFTTWEFNGPFVARSILHRRRPVCCTYRLTGSLSGRTASVCKPPAPPSALPSLLLLAKSVSCTLGSYRAHPASAVGATGCQECALVQSSFFLPVRCLFPLRSLPPSQSRPDL